MSSGATKGEDIFGVLRRRLTKALVGLSRDLPEDWHEHQLKSRAQPPRTEFPVPELVLFALRNVLGCRWTGQGEKIRWSVYCTFNSALVSFELRKFGFTICAAEDAAIDLERLCGQLRVAVKHVEAWLKPIAKAQASKGNVSVENRHREFDSRYLFFRKRADKAYRRADPKSRKQSESKVKEDHSAAIKKHLATFGDSWRQMTFGFFYSTAMIDAFFSRLEHNLVLLRAFCGDPLTDGQLTTFLSMTWDNKLKALVDVNEPAMQKLYSELKRIKERIRNPFAHGGVENDNGSLFVHIPTLGALPANFTQVRNSVRFNFVPVGKDDHGSACAVFDSFDKAMRRGSLSGAYSFVEAGIDPSFNAANLVLYGGLVQAPAKQRKKWFESWHYENDRQSNMDY